MNLRVVYDWPPIYNSSPRFKTSNQGPTRDSIEVPKTLASLVVFISPQTPKRHLTFTILRKMNLVVYTVVYHW